MLLGLFIPAFLPHPNLRPAPISTQRHCAAVALAKNNTEKSFRFAGPIKYNFRWPANLRGWQRGDDSDIRGRDGGIRTKQALGTALAMGGAGWLASRRSKTLPVVLVHGILDTAENMEQSAEWVRSALGGGSWRGGTGCSAAALAAAAALRTS